ncbi:MAG: phosphatidylserine decarboxylase, partial [Akkermansiaceae bacterium]|nr:phosphatidylserine decarboxylase [Akkermansiaceae bacterium]
YGTILTLEIGATNVGSIQQTFIPGHAVTRGEEKGYFAFGGSSIITI